MFQLHFQAAVGGFGLDDILVVFRRISAGSEADMLENKNVVQKITYERVLVKKCPFFCLCVLCSEILYL